MNFVLHCRSFLEVICITPKLLYIFYCLIFFHVSLFVILYSICLVLGEEIIFNFDNLIFLVISIGSWVFVLVRGMPILIRKKSPKKDFHLSPHPPFSHTQLSFFLFWQQWPKVMQDDKSYRRISPMILLELGDTEVFLKCRVGLWSEIDSIRKDWLENSPPG